MEQFFSDAANMPKMERVHIYPIFSQGTFFEFDDDVPNFPLFGGISIRSPGGYGSTLPNHGAVLPIYTFKTEAIFEKNENPEKRTHIGTLRSMI